jgi:hypothetical protein
MLRSTNPFANQQLSLAHELLKPILHELHDALGMTPDIIASALLTWCIIGLHAVYTNRGESFDEASASAIDWCIKYLEASR